MAGHAACWSRMKPCLFRCSSTHKLWFIFLLLQGKVMVPANAQAVYREHHTSPHASFLTRCPLDFFRCKSVVSELFLRYLFERTVTIDPTIVANISVWVLECCAQCERYPGASSTRPMSQELSLTSAIISTLHHITTYTISSSLHSR